MIKIIRKSCYIFQDKLWICGPEFYIRRQEKEDSAVRSVKVKKLKKKLSYKFWTN